MTVSEPAQHEPEIVENVPRLASYGAYLREVWDRRGLVRILSARKLRANYELSLVGFGWWLLEPITQTAVYFVLFNVIFNGRRENFIVWLLAALLPYKWFRQTVLQSMGTVRANANLISDLYFPRALLPIADMSVALSHFLVGLLIFPPVLLIHGLWFTPKLAILPLVMAVQLLLSLGFAYPFAVWGLYYQNLQNFSGNLLRLWFYLSPSIWAVEDLRNRIEDPERFEMIRTIIRLNPLTGLFEGYRSALLGMPIRWADLAITMAWAVAMLVLGSYYFTRRESQFGKLL